MRKGSRPDRTPVSLGDDALCTVMDVAHALGATCLDVGELVLTGQLRSVVIPGLGRRVRVGDFRRFIKSLPPPERDGDGRDKA